MKYQRMFQPCPKCGSTMNPRAKTCGLCAGKGYKPQLHLVTCTCESCGNPFELPQWRVHQGRGRFCSKACRDKWQATLTGDKNSKYRGPQGHYRGTNWKEARKAALEAYGYKCVVCQCDLRLLSPYKYVVHHHIPFTTFADEEHANALDNLQPMCKSCHAKVEGLGKTTATKEVMPNGARN